MRVIAGVHRGRRLLGPTGSALRPTSDRVKEAMFSIVGDRIIGARVVDLYAGTGSLGIEALSRGAAHVTFVEENRSAGRILKANLERCRFLSSERTQVWTCRVETFFREDQRSLEPYDLVLADPPYADTFKLIDTVRTAPVGRFASDGYLMIEHGKKATLPPDVGPYRLVRRYDYGDTSLSLFHRTAEPVGPS
ncbi:MAG TPA: 16S rRNA (guanine(966)-N(2))-methyltransferase RsmD [Nitrospiraceae bacterium]|nr:16S rRNA (guanine(966)-N(2))-methyltransferase RsmD [Nitrospiraceae bacterium]